MDLFNKNNKIFMLSFSDNNNIISNSIRSLETQKNKQIGYINPNDFKLLITNNNSKSKEYTIKVDNYITPKLLYTKETKNKTLTFKSKIIKKIKLIDDNFKIEKEQNNNIKLIDFNKNKDLTANIIPKAKIAILEGDNKIKTMKMERNDLKSELFNLFSQKSELTFDDINLYLDQPRGYVMEILDEICDKRKHLNKYVYYLKQIYTKFNEGDFLKKYKNK